MSTTKAFAKTRLKKLPKMSPDRFRATHFHRTFFTRQPGGFPPSTWWFVQYTGLWHREADYVGKIESAVYRLAAQFGAEVESDIGLRKIVVGFFLKFPSALAARSALKVLIHVWGKIYGSAITKSNEDDMTYTLFDGPSPSILHPIQKSSTEFYVYLFPHIFQ